MAFKLSKEQLARRHALAADLRDKALTLNIAIAAFNRGVEPLVEAVAKAQDDYNELLEIARNLAERIAENAREEFEAKSERWQEGEKGQQVREWIERWEMSLEEISIELPEALEEIEPDEHAGEIEEAPATLVAMEHVLTQ
jgi:hypothetical protein